MTEHRHPRGTFFNKHQKRAETIRRSPWELLVVLYFIFRAFRRGMARYQSSDPNSQFLFWVVISLICFAAYMYIFVQSAKFCQTYFEFKKPLKRQRLPYSEIGAIEIIDRVDDIFGRFRLVIYKKGVRKPWLTFSFGPQQNIRLVYLLIKYAPLLTVRFRKLKPPHSCTLDSSQVFNLLEPTALSKRWVSPRFNGKSPSEELMASLVRYKALRAEKRKSQTDSARSLMPSSIKKERGANNIS